MVESRPRKSHSSYAIKRVSAPSAISAARTEWIHHIGNEVTRRGLQSSELGGSVAHETSPNRGYVLPEQELFPRASLTRRFYRGGSSHL